MGKVEAMRLTTFVINPPRRLVYHQEKASGLVLHAYVKAVEPCGTDRSLVQISR